MASPTHSNAIVLFSKIKYLKRKLAKENNGNAISSTSTI